MNRLFFYATTGAILFAYSCAPVYKCGEAVPEKKLLAGKRLKSVVAERDGLCASLASKEAENEALKENVAGLENLKEALHGRNNRLMLKIDTMQKKYDNLINENLSQSDQYNKSLKAKTDELNRKEQLLAEREKALKELQQKIARQDSITKRLNDVIRNAMLGFNPDELSVEIINGKVYVSMSDKLLFKSGSAAIENKGKDALKVLSEVLEKNPDIDILVEGHTDNIPIKTAVFRDNWDLSVVRATSIVKILTEDYKIQPTRVTASGRGEFFPKAVNDSPEGRAKNRRTEIILSPKLDEIMKLINQK
jgi:chemotaxis protein MotB